MKSIFDIIMLIFVSMTMLISMLFFTEEVLVQQQAVHIRNHIVNLIEIEGGYTSEVENQITYDLKDFSKEVEINVSKYGKLNYGEKVEIEVLLKHMRKLPFTDNSLKEVQYRSEGVYYNVNP